MAENETLDLGDRRNRRWRHFCDRVLGGATSEEAATCLANCVTGTLKRILRNDPAHGGPEYPVAQLLDAMQRGEVDRDAVLSQCHGHQFAHLLAEEDCGRDPESTIRSHCDRIAGKFWDQIEIEAVPSRFGSFDESRLFYAELKQHAASMLNEIARQVGNNPTKPPRSRSRPKAEREGQQRSILQESLLSRSGVRS